MGQTRGASGGGDAPEIPAADEDFGGAILLDPEFRSRYVSPGVVRLFGRSVEALTGEVVWEMLPQLAGDEIERTVRRAMKSRVAARAEQALPSCGGRYEAYCAPVADGLAVVLRELDARHEAEALRRFLQSAMDHTEDAILVTEAAPLDPPGPRVVFANPAFTRMTGYEPEDILGETPRVLQGPDTNRAALDEIRERLARWEPCRAELLNYRKDRTPFWVDMNIYPVADEAGRFTHWVSIQRDVTRQKMVEDALAQSARDYVTLADGLPFSLVRYDRDLRVLYANEAVVEYFGLTRDEIIGRDLYELGLTDVMVEERRAMIHQVFATGRPIITEFCSPQRNGEPRWFEMRVYPEFAPDGGRVESALVMNQDVHERRVAGEALRRNEEHLRRLVENSPDCIKLLDLTGRVLTMNEGGQAVLEIDDFEQVRGADWTGLWPDECRDAARRAIASALFGERSRFQGYGPTLKGTLKFWDNIITPLRGPNGRPEALLCISRDITEIKRLEEQKEALLREARERADRDPLTGLYTHRAFLERLEVLSEVADQTGEPLAVAVLDVDNFKFFNEAFGHLGGDAVLAYIADGLRASCRKGDVLARFGGDEFAVLLPGLRRDDAERLLKTRLQQGEFAGGYHPEGHSAPVPLRVSVGVSDYPEDARNPLHALARADERLFENKRDEAEELYAVRENLTRRFPGFPLLNSLVLAVDAKDRYTRRHSEEVMAYAARIADAVGLPPEEREILLVSALVHDAGKIGVADRVLRLPRPLRPDEQEEIRRHAALGAGLAQTLLGEPRVTDAVRHHHEAWDGSGYPDGLAGEAIPPLARLLAVADAYSAMTSDRPYRKGRAPAEAFDELERGAGHQWDARYVTALVRALRL
jgi:diguanylate cyclase (GGDEF)-like protein/PAS domain S-box-containing protein/putative nucleotidyltransferase with HDIG domain